MRYQGICLAFLVTATASAQADDGDVPAKSWNKALAAKYLDERAETWFAFDGADRGVGADKVSCVSCHGMLPFALARPVLRKLSGQAEPTELEAKLLTQIKSRVEHWKELDSEKFRLYYDFSDEKKQQSWGTEAVFNSLILATDDVLAGRKAMSDITKKAFANLWQVQTAGGDQAGSWDWINFGMEPWESNNSRYFGATLGALAVGTAPGYFTPGSDAALDKKVEKLRCYLRDKMPAQNLNNRVWLLWASTKLDGLLTKDECQSTIAAIFAKQQPDGGWNLASLGTIVPKNFTPDASADGYATGLILHVLQTASVGKSDARLAKGLAWLESHQTGTGAWRANSVNKQRDPATHVGKFMSDAATAYAVLALSH
jgi:squalene-hopene/tetraprenyl-beta-curcumene cyclase